MITGLPWRHCVVGILGTLGIALAGCVQGEGAGVASDPARSVDVADPLARYQAEYPQRYPCAGAVPRCWGAPQF